MPRRKVIKKKTTKKSNEETNKFLINVMKGASRIFSNK